jgi:hypothetical protein
MDITKFARKVAKLEGGANEVNIAQISEILKVINGLLGGVLYAIIKLI